MADADPQFRGTSAGVAAERLCCRNALWELTGNGGG